MGAFLGLLEPLMMGRQIVLGCASGAFLGRTVFFNLNLDLLKQHELALERTNMLGRLAGKDGRYLRKVRLLVVGPEGLGRL